MGTEPDLQIATACNVSEEFTKLFFEASDAKRHNLNRFYMDNATLSWDGNPTSGKDNIEKFFLLSIPITTHTLHALDAQPVAIEAVKGQQTVLVQVAGLVKFGQDRKSTGFTRSFVITAQDNKWKIFSDCCRLQKSVSENKSTG